MKSNLNLTQAPFSFIFLCWFVLCQSILSLEIYMGFLFFMHLIYAFTVPFLRMPSTYLSSLLFWCMTFVFIINSHTRFVVGLYTISPTHLWVPRGWASKIMLYMRKAQKICYERKESFEEIICICIMWWS